MTIRIMKRDRTMQALTRSDMDQRMEQERLEAFEWSSEPNQHFHEHVHELRTIMYCLSGSITFHGPDGDYVLEPGDRLEIDADTPHAATVGNQGVACLEATY